MEESEIEGRAEAVLDALPDYIWRREIPPVPVEEIAESWFGLRVRRVPADRMRDAPGLVDPGEGTISGLLIPSLGEIWVNRDECEAERWGPRRMRFTIGHELGHHVLHQPGQQTLFCRKPNVDPADGERPARPAAEEEADVFAASLLMPAEMVRDEYARDRRFEWLCELFEASGAAMGRRLHRVI